MHIKLSGLVSVAAGFLFHSRIEFIVSWPHLGEKISHEVQWKLWLWWSMEWWGWRMKKMKTYWWVTGFHVHVSTLNWSFFNGERLSTVLLWPELAAGNLALTQEMADRPNFISFNTAAWHTLEYCTHISFVSYCVYWLLTDWFYSHQSHRQFNYQHLGH